MIKLNSIESNLIDCNQIQLQITWNSFQMVWIWFEHDFLHHPTSNNSINRPRPYVDSSRGPPDTTLWISEVAPLRSWAVFSVEPSVLPSFLRGRTQGRAFQQIINSITMYTHFIASLYHQCYSNFISHILSQCMTIV